MRSRRCHPLILFVALLLPLAPLSTRAEAPATAPSAADREPEAFLLHLPGIGGHRFIDDMLVGGLRQGGVAGETEIYDWTGDNPGLAALLARQRNELQAAEIARIMERRVRTAAGAPVILTGHSGGAAVAVWALERLPADVSIDTLVLLAPALSPNYNLTRALEHVRGKVYVLTSPYDVVLGAGTRMFGTMDGVKTDAAGRVGFARPDGADPLQYAKLVPMPYDSAWLRYRNIGDHVGPMMRPFVREILAPVLRGSSGRGVPAVVPAAAATPPAATQATR